MHPYLTNLIERLRADENYFPLSESARGVWDFIFLVLYLLRYAFCTQPLYGTSKHPYYLWLLWLCSVITIKSQTHTSQIKMYCNYSKKRTKLPKKKVILFLIDLIIYFSNRIFLMAHFWRTGLPQASGILICIVRVYCYILAAMIQKHSIF